MGELRATLKRNPGLVVSGGAHALALICMLLKFSSAPPFEETPETVPVEMITTSELNQITNGEKTAKLMPTPQRRVDKVAALEDHKTAPPTPDAKQDLPSEASPDKAIDDPGHAEAKPPAPVAALPPPPPAPIAPPAPLPPPAPAVPTPPERPVEKVETPQPAVPTPPERPVEAEAKPTPDDSKPPPPEAETVAPAPPPRPKIEPPKHAKAEPKKVEPKPLPLARPVETKVAKVVPPPPPPPPRPPVKPDPKLFDRVASMLDKMKPDKPLDKVASFLDKLKPDPVKPEPVERPRSGNETKDAKPHDDFNPDKIAAMLSHEAPQRKASTGRALTQVASLGSPTAHAEKMSPTVAAQLDGWLIDHYRGCWSYFGLGSTQDYVPQLRIRMAQDGSLIGSPSLLNPPSDPNLKSLAESAIRAVNRCNPLEIPERFRPYYDQGYKQRVVRFDPKEMS